TRVRWPEPRRSSWPERRPARWPGQRRGGRAAPGGGGPPCPGARRRGGRGGGALAWPEADGLAWGAADAWPTCCDATACGDGCDFFEWLAEGLGLALGLAP